MLHETKKPGAEWNKNSVIPNLNTSAEKISTHIWFDDNSIEKWLCRLFPHLIFLGLNVSLSSLLLLFLFLLTAHTQTHTRTGLLIPSPSAVFQHAAGVTDD